MRRSLFVILVALLVAFGYYRWERLKSSADGRRVPEKYTPAAGPKLDLKDLQVLSAIDAEYTRLINAVAPSVVSVTSRNVAPNASPVDPLELFFRRRGRQEPGLASLGSGVIVSQEGHVITNHHVIAQKNEIEVQLNDGRTEPAQLIGSDEVTDIAVLKISARNLEALPLGDSDQVNVGQMVFAIGNPFGLRETVTQGIISAKGRRAIIDSGVEVLQTDAAVNRGNSGGPLLNLRGEIIGINTAIYSEAETGGWQGISFAIPSNVARRALESLLKTGRVVRGYLGVEMLELTPEHARKMGLPDTSGALVADVFTGSPAEKAGLQPGDLVRKFNGRKVEDSRALRSRVAEAELSKDLEITIVRQGKEMTLTAQILEAPGNLALAPRRKSTPVPALPNPAQLATSNVLSGIAVSEITAAQRDRLPPDVEGVVVVQMQPDAPGMDKLRVGDVIEEINRRPVISVAEFEKTARAFPAGERALLYIVRGQSRSYVVLTP